MNETAAFVESTERQFYFPWFIFYQNASSHFRQFDEVRPLQNDMNLSNFHQFRQLVQKYNWFSAIRRKVSFLSTRHFHRATIRTKHISIICSSKHLGIFNAFTISITIKAGKFPGEIFHKRKFFLPYRRKELYDARVKPVDSNVCLHTNCYLLAWPAKHRQEADLLANLRDWRWLQDCGNCMAMEQSVASVRRLNTIPYFINGISVG